MGEERERERKQTRKEGDKRLYLENHGWYESISIKSGTEVDVRKLSEYRAKYIANIEPNGLLVRRAPNGS